jgi:hypothetical protein
VVRESRRGCYGWGRLPFQSVMNDKLGRDLLPKGIVTYADIGALSRFGCTVFHASPPFYSTMPASVLRGKIINGAICVEGKQSAGPLALFD